MRSRHFFASDELWQQAERAALTRSMRTHRRVSASEIVREGITLAVQLETEQNAKQAE